MILNSPPENLISRRRVTWGWAEGVPRVWPEVVSAHLSLIEGRACATYKLHKDSSPGSLRVPSSSSGPSCLERWGSVTCQLTCQTPDFSHTGPPWPEELSVIPLLQSPARVPMASATNFELFTGAPSHLPHLLLMTPPP